MEHTAQHDLARALILFRERTYVGVAVLAVAMGFAFADQARFVGLAVIALVAAAAGRVRREVPPLAGVLALDAAVAVTLWWVFGPIVGVDFILFYVVAAGAVLLPLRTALRLVAMAIAAELAVVPLHFWSLETHLPLFHPPAQVQSNVEFLMGVGLRIAFLGVTAALFLTISSMLGRAELRRVASERQFRALYEEAPYAYLSVGRDGLIRQANTAAEHVLGRPRDDLADRSCVDLYQPGPEGRERAQEALGRVMMGDSVENLELQVDRPDGGLPWVALSAVPVRDDSGEVVEVRAALSDISERKRAEMMREEAQRQLEELLRSKDSFIAAVSHELRTPLSAVLGFAEHLRSNQDRVDAAESQEYLDLIAIQSTEMAFLVDDLLVAARADVGEITIVPDRTVAAAEIRTVVDTCRMCAEDVDERVRLDLDDSLVVWADAGRYRQVVRNLVTNALRYGGHHITIRQEAKDGRSILEVADDGDPIDADRRDLIFEPYGRAHELRGLAGSVGLGLSVARTLAELMGGDLVYDHDGTESVFRLTLPTSRLQRAA